MPAKKHNFTATEIKAGALVLVALLLLGGFLAVVLGFRGNEVYHTYYASFTNIIGLNPGADVRYGGLKVGSVSGIYPDPDDQSQIIVEARVREGTPVNEESLATITYVSLTSPMHLEISTGEADAALVPPGERLNAQTLGGGFIELPDLAGVVDESELLLSDLRDFLGVEETQEEVAMGEGEFVRMTEVVAGVRSGVDKASGLVDSINATLDENRPNIDRLFARADAIAADAEELAGQLKATLEENRPALRRTLASAEDVMADATRVSDRLAARIEEVIDQLNRALAGAEGLTGDTSALIDDNRPLIESTLDDLQEALRDLKAFAQTVSDQPDALLRGRRPQGRMP